MPKISHAGPKAKTRQPCSNRLGETYVGRPPAFIATPKNRKERLAKQAHERSARA